MYYFDYLHIKKAAVLKRKKVQMEKNKAENETKKTTKKKKKLLKFWPTNYFLIIIHCKNY